MVAFLIFIFGLMIGSFLNVVILRLKNNEKFIRGRSHCPKCKHQLKWYENIPLLSFIFLKAKCKYCKQKISLQYPLVELATGLLFLLAFLNVSPPLFKGGLGGLNIFYYFIILSFLIIIFVYDLKYYLILDKISIPAIIFVLLFKILNFPEFIIYYLLSACVISGFFLLQYLLSKGKWVGGGDIRLGLFMGIILGWPNILVGLLLAYIFGAVAGVMLILLKRRKIRSEIPFGTFLTVGTLVAMFWGTSIINWYMSLL